MVSELRTRKVKSPNDRPLKTDGEYSKVDPAADKSRAVTTVAGGDGGGGLSRRLLDWDREATLKCSICAAPDSGRNYLRYFFKALEISGHGVPWIAIPIALMCYSDDPWLMELLLNLLAGIFLDLFVSIILKAAVQRPRPMVNQNDMFFAVSVDNKFSFPSGHCTRVGMLAYFFIVNLNLTVHQTALYLLWTIGIAASRLCLGRHYVTDIVCGILIGTLQGIFIQYYWMSLENFDYLKNYFT